MRQSLGWRGSSGSLLHLLATGPGLDRAGPGRLALDARRVRQNLREHPPRAGVSSWPRWLTRGDVEDRQPSYTPDGERIVFTSNRGGNPDLWEVSVATGRLRRLTEHPADDVAPEVLGSGRIVWASRRTGSFEAWIAEPDGSVARQLSHEGGDVAHPAATRSGRWILYAARQPEQAGLWIVRPDGSETTPLIPGRVGPIAVSPDGDYVVFVEMRSSQNVLRVFRFGDTRLLTAEVPLTSPAIARPCFLPDGRVIAFVDVDDSGRSGVFVQDFDALRGFSGSRRPLAGFDPDLEVDSFAFSPDGERLTIAYAETQLGLMLAEGLPGVPR
jgi:Tol biopolymer transport system component